MTDAGRRQPCCNPAADILGDGLSDVARELAAAGFAALWDGRPLRPRDLLPRHGASVDQAVAALVETGRADVDDDGRLVGVHGLTLRPSRHRFVHQGCPHYTRCAFDAVGIPAALRLDAVARTSCPTCGRPLTVDIRRGAPANGDGMVLWLPAATGMDFRAEFCAAADLYCSRDHLEQRITTSRTAGDFVDLASAASAGCETWADVAGIKVDGRTDA